MTIEEAEEAVSQWCPFCCRKIKPSNWIEFENGEDSGLIYVHDDGVDHDEDYNFEKCTKPTARQQQVLDYVVKCQEEGFTPSRMEISHHLGLVSFHGANGHLLALEKKGYVKLSTRYHRRIKVL